MPSISTMHSDLQAKDGWVAAVNRFHSAMDDQLAKLRISLLEHQRQNKADNIAEQGFASLKHSEEKIDATVVVPLGVVVPQNDPHGLAESLGMDHDPESCVEKWLRLASRVLESNHSIYGEFAEHVIWLYVDEKWLSDEPDRSSRDRCTNMTIVSSATASTRRIVRHKKRFVGLFVKAYQNVLQKSVNRVTHGFWDHKIVAHPYSCRRTVWVCLSLLCILLDFIMVSMTPFNMFGPAMLWASDWCISTFWTLDIVMSFTTGQYRRGRLEMRWREVALHYVRRWFIVDVFIVTLSWLSVLLAGGDGLASRSAAVTVVPLRVGRLGRILSLRWILRSTLIRRPSDGPLLMSIVFVMCLVVFVHTCSCIWYWLGDCQNGWVTRSERVRDTGSTAGALHNYLLSMTWAMSTLQGNSDFDSSTQEMIFELAVSFISMIVLAAFVSALTNTMAQIINAKAKTTATKRSVWAFLLKHEISCELADKVKNYLIARVRVEFQQEGEEEKHALESLPPQLKRRLLAEARSHYLNWHPILPFVQMTNLRLHVNICCDAIVQATLEEFDDVFFVGDPCISAYFVLAGTFLLTGILSVAAEDIGRELADMIHRQSSHSHSRPSQRSSRPSQRSSGSALSKGYYPFTGKPSQKSIDPRIVQDTRSVNKNSVVSEAALWMRCRHSGSLTSLGHGVLYIMDADSFMKLVYCDPWIFRTLAWHAHRYVMRAKDAMCSDRNWVLDLFDYRAFMDRDLQVGTLSLSSEFSGRLQTCSV